MDDQEQDEFDPILQKRYEAYLQDGTLNRDRHKHAMAKDMLARGIVRSPATPQQQSTAKADNQSRLTLSGAPTPDTIAGRPRETTLPKSPPSRRNTPTSPSPSLKQPDKNYFQKVQDIAASAIAGDGNPLEKIGEVLASPVRAAYESVVPPQTRQDVSDFGFNAGTAAINATPIVSQLAQKTLPPKTSLPHRKGEVSMAAPHGDKSKTTMAQAAGTAFGHAVPGIVGGLAGAGAVGALAAPVVESLAGGNALAQIAAPALAAGSGFLSFAGGQTGTEMAGNAGLSPEEQQAKGEALAQANKEEPLGAFAGDVAAQVGAFGLNPTGIAKDAQFLGLLRREGAAATRATIGEAAFHQGMAGLFNRGILTGVGANELIHEYNTTGDISPLTIAKAFAPQLMGHPTKLGEIPDSLGRHVGEGINEMVGVHPAMVPLAPPPTIRDLVEDGSPEIDVRGALAAGAAHVNRVPIAAHVPEPAPHAPLAPPIVPPAPVVESTTAVQNPTPAGAASVQENRAIPATTAPSVTPLPDANVQVPVQPATPNPETLTSVGTDSSPSPRGREGLVNSPVFKRWFGNWEDVTGEHSQIVDNDFKPLVVYHGTGNAFDNFSKSSQGNAFGEGYYFTDNPAEASDYAEGSARRGNTLEDGRAPNVRPAFLNIRDPFRLDGVVGIDTLKRVGKAIGDKAFLKQFKDPYRSKGWDVWSKLLDNGDVETANKVMRKAGFDGLIANSDGLSDRKALYFVAFDPSQIQSAFGSGFNTKGLSDTPTPSLLDQPQETPKIDNALAPVAETAKPEPPPVTPPPSPAREFVSGLKELPNKAMGIKPYGEAYLAWKESGSPQGKEPKSYDYGLSIGAKDRIKTKIDRLTAEAPAFKPLESKLAGGEWAGNSPDATATDGTRMARRPADTPEPTGVLAKRGTRVKETGEGAVVYLSKTDADLLRKFVDEASWNETMLPGARVAKELPLVEAEIARLHDAGKDTTALSKLHETLKTATDQGVADTVFVDSSRPIAEVTADRREGATHRSLRDLMTAPIIKATTDHPLWQRVSESLDKGGYGEETPAVKAEEAIAKILSGKHSELGLSKSEARGIFADMVDAGTAEHGDAFRLALEHGTREYRGIADEQIAKSRAGGDGIHGRGDNSDQRPIADASAPDGGAGGIGTDAGLDPAGRSDPGGIRQPTASDRLNTAGRQRIDRLKTSLGDEMKTLPQSVQEGLSHWYGSRDLNRAARHAGVAPADLMYEAVKRGIAPPAAKDKDTTALGLWVENTHPGVPTDKYVWAESPYEAVRLAQLNGYTSVESVSRGSRLQVVDPKTGEIFSYTPDFIVKYKNNREIHEEIKGQNWRNTEHVQKKTRAIRVYLNRLANNQRMGNRRYGYRIVTESELGPELFKAARSSTTLKQYVPESMHATLDQRLKAATGQARRQQNRVAQENTRFARKPPAQTPSPNPTTPVAPAKPTSEPTTPEKRRLVDDVDTISKAGMLAAPPTHIRNVVGNLGNIVAEEAALVPASLVDMSRVAIEHAKGNDAERTVPNPSLVAMGRSGYAAATRGMREAGQIIKTGKVQGDDPFEQAQNALETAGIDQETVTKSPILNTVINGSFRALTAEDRVFKIYGLTRSIEGQAPFVAKMEAKAINRAIEKQGFAQGPEGKIEKLVSPRWVAERTKVLRKTPTEAMLAQAVGDAEVATFNNANRVADAHREVNRVLRGDPTGIASLLYNTGMRFVKTPTNVLFRTLEYALGPVTMAGSAVRAGVEAARTPRLQKAVNEAQTKLDAATAEAKNPPLIGHDPNGKPIYSEASKAKKAEAEIDFKAASKELADKAFTPEAQKRFAQTFGRGAIGPAFIALGHALASAGVLTGYSYDPQDRKDRKEADAPEESIRIGDRWYKIGFAAPIGPLLMIGATLHERQGDWGGDTGKWAMTYLSTGLHVMADAPQVRGQDTFSAFASGDPHKLGKAAGDIATSYLPGSAVLRTAADMMDDKKRSPQNTGDQIKMNVPGLRQQVPEGEGEKPNALDPFRSVKGAPGDPDVFTARLLRHRLLADEITEKMAALDPEARTTENKEFLEAHNRRKYQKLSLPQLQGMAKDRGWTRSSLLDLLTGAKK